MTIKLKLVPAVSEDSCVGCAHYLHAPNYIPGTGCNEQAVSERNEDKCLGGEMGQIWVEDVRPCVPTARANDPATSKGKRKVNKYEQAVLDTLAMDAKSSAPTGFTGKDIAAFTEMPLNCITPRFAPLRRKGLIKDSGAKRDKQIVWVLA